MTASLPPADPLQGNYVRLEPLTRTALPELFTAIAHPEVFAGGYGGGPAGLPDTLDGFLDFALAYYPWDRGMPWLARLSGGPDDGVAVGTSSLTDFDFDREHAHIGYTAYHPAVWASAVNVECKLLLLDLAFSSGFGRVKLQADVLNSRSRAAIAKLGASFEGIVRRDVLRADGSWRDTAVFSILVDEWPDVRRNLVGRLAAFREHPRLMMN